MTRKRRIEELETRVAELNNRLNDVGYAVEKLRFPCGRIYLKEYGKCFFAYNKVQYLLPINIQPTKYRCDGKYLEIFYVGFHARSFLYRIGEYEVVEIEEGTISSTAEYYDYNGVKI